MMKYKERLDQAFTDPTYGDNYTSKLNFVGEVIFDFTCYDSSVSEELAKKMIEVIECILKQKTFKYQDFSRENYINYLTMVNMPFMQGKLDWGGSIRGAWFDKYGHHTEKPQEKIYQITYEWAIPKGEIDDFLTALLEWVKL